jgi:hypothetical protein
LVPTLDLGDGVVRSPLGPEPVGDRLEVGLEDGFQHKLQRRLNDPVRDRTEVLREEVTAVLAPLGLRLSQAKTQVVHMADGFDFLGFRIQWRRKRGTNTWWKWKDVRRHLVTPTGRWRRPAAGGTELFNIASITITRYRYPVPSATVRICEGRGLRCPRLLGHPQRR